MKTKSLLTIGMLSLWLSSCSTNDAPDAPVQPNSPDDNKEGILPSHPTMSEIGITEAEQEMCVAINNLGLEVFKNAIEDKDFLKDNPNAAVSPINLTLGLGLVTNFIDHVVAEKLSYDLGFNSVKEYNELCRKLMNFLPGTTNQNNLELANSLWHSQSLIPSDEYVKIMEDYYFGKLKSVDFLSNGVGTEINNWVSEATHGLINNIVNDVIDKNTKLIFASALYFNGEWKNQFDEHSTITYPFITGQDVLDVNMMSHKANYQYYKGQNYQAITLPYKGKTEMIAILPSEATTLENMIKTFTVDELDVISNGLKEEEIKLKFPRFESSAKIDCKAVFANMGIDLAESNISGFNKIYSSESYPLTILHQTFVKTTEKGTEAAAVTSGEVGSMPENVKQLTFNRPFLYIIRNTVTGSIIMMGQVTEP